MIEPLPSPVNTNERLEAGVENLIGMVESRVRQRDAAYDENAALRAEVKQLHALLVEIREPIEDTYEDSGNWSDLRDVLRKIDAALTGKG